MKILSDYRFWIKVSNISIIICGLFVIINMFFIQYFGFRGKSVIIYIGIISILFFLISEFIKFILKRKIYEK
jgi:hypothetical protein